jgi:hypothetical protein|nr:MAG TPA: hypothetical protein [Caudoviricetes sp.]
MVKRWKEIDEVIKPTIEVPKELWKLDQQMKEVPNFNKSQGSRKIFQRKEYSIYKASGGYIIHNTNGDFRNHHTHVRTFSKAKSIVDLCIRKKLPNTPRKWEIESLMRLTRNNAYYNKLRDLLEGLGE